MHWDAFNSDAFSLITMTEAISRMPYVPQTLAAMNLFEERGVATTTVSVNTKNRTLTLVPAVNRSAAPMAPSQPIPHNKADVIPIPNLTRLTQEDTILSHEVQDRRRWNSENELLSVMDLILERTEDMQRNLRATLELHRLGAARGIVIDADGSTELFNWFTIFNVTPAATVFFDFANAVAPEVLNTCHALRRSMVRASGNAMTENTPIVALCGDNFYDDLTGHPEVRDTYANWSAASSLLGNDGTFRVFGAFRFGEINFINYRSTDDGGASPAVGIPTEEAAFFPLLRGEMFRTYWMPHETFESVNMPGREMYAQVVPDRDRNAFVKYFLDSYPMFMNRRPELCRTGSTAAS